MTESPQTGRCIGASSGIKPAVYGLCITCGNHLRPGAADIQPMAYRDTLGVIVCANWVNTDLLPGKCRQAFPGP